MPRTEAGGARGERSTDAGSDIPVHHRATRATGATTATEAPRQSMREIPGMQRVQPRETHEGEGLANALGWLSVGLGLAGLMAPRRVARTIGIRDDSRNRTVMRALGLRELTSGTGILSRRRRADWMWARVAGDVMDLALLRTALGAPGTRRGRAAAATAAVLGVTALDIRTGDRLRRRLGAAGVAAKPRAIRVKETVTVNRPPEEVYQFWHDFENLPRFMQHLEAVQVIGGGRSHWKARAPAGTTVEWDAEIIEDRPNELIAWRSVEGADVHNAGSVRFAPAPGGRGTEVTVEMQYEPPAGAIGAAFAKLFREEPAQQIKNDLRAFKQVMETGEVLRSDASVHRGPHPASPPERPVTT